MEKEKHFDFLDSLRGIAAVTVICSHLDLDYYHMEDWFPLLHKSPFHILYDGNAAVVFFFVLSGFVLSYKPYGAAHKTGNCLLFPFYIKRFFRIFPAYWAVLILSALLGCLVYHGYTTIPERTWTIWWWNQPFDLSSFFQQMKLILIRPVQGNFYVPQSWSLSPEIFLSLWLPVFVLVISQNKSLFITTVLILLFICDFDNLIIPFSVGMLYAINLNQVNRYIQLKGRGVVVFLLLTGLLLYGYRYSISVYFPHRSILQKIIFNERFIDLMTSLGAFLILIAVFNSRKLKRLFSFRLFTFIGKVSFSIYLCHTIVMVMWTPPFIQLINHSITQKIPVFIIATIFTIVVSILLSTILYYLLEKPGIRLGKKVASFISKK